MKEDTIYLIYVLSFPPYSLSLKHKLFKDSLRTGEHTSDAEFTSNLDIFTR